MLILNSSVGCKVLDGDCKRDQKITGKIYFEIDSMPLKETAFKLASVEYTKNHETVLATFSTRIDGSFEINANFAVCNYPDIRICWPYEKADDNILYSLRVNFAAKTIDTNIGTIYVKP